MRILCPVILPATSIVPPRNTKFARRRAVGSEFVGAVTVHPEEVARDFLDLVTTIVGVGDGSRAAIDAFCTATGRDRPEAAGTIRPDEVHVWTGGGTVGVVSVTKPEERQKRHARKYADGELGEDRSFYFRGPAAALNLRAQNLSTFLQLADGVDDETWLYHLRGNDYSRWFRKAIKDDALASEVSAVEGDRSLSAADSRKQIRDMVETRYTAPAKQK
jgi:hypothetical protein